MLQIARDKETNRYYLVNAMYRDAQHGVHDWFAFQILRELDDELQKALQNADPCVTQALMEYRNVEDEDEDD